MSLHRRRDIRIGTDSAAQFHNGDRVAGGRQSLEVAIDLECPERDLRAEGGGLSVDPMGAADGDGVAMSFCEVDHRRTQAHERLDDEVRGIAKRPAERGVDHI